jgi:hypothetical protein
LLQMIGAPTQLRRFVGAFAISISDMRLLAALGQSSSAAVTTKFLQIKPLLYFGLLTDC